MAGPETVWMGAFLPSRRGKQRSPAQPEPKGAQEIGDWQWHSRPILRPDNADHGCRIAAPAAVRRTCPFPSHCLETHCCFSVSDLSFAAISVFHSRWL